MKQTKCFLIFLLHGVDNLLEWDESGAVGGTDTGTTVLNRLVCDAELSQIVSNHLRLKNNHQRNL